MSSSVQELPTVRGEGRLSRGEGPHSLGDGPQSRGEGPQSRGDGPHSRGDGPQSRGDGPQSEGGADRGSLLRGPRGPLGSSSAITLRAVLSTVALDWPAGERSVPPAEPRGSAQRGRWVSLGTTLDDELMRASTSSGGSGLRSGRERRKPIRTASPRSRRGIMLLRFLHAQRLMEFHASTAGLWQGLFRHKNTVRCAHEVSGGMYEQMWPSLRSMANVVADFWGEL